MRKLLSALFIMLAIVALVAGGIPQQTGASSHREAPMISQDPVADGTDLYMFVSPDRAGTVTLIANYIPFEVQDSGPNFNSFGDDVMYRINIDNDGDTMADVMYEFDFNTTRRNGDTFLYNTGPMLSIDDPNRNVLQHYTVTERREDGSSRVIAENLLTPPPNIGPKSTPDYTSLANAATYQVEGGAMVFAGQRDDPFFVDLEVFDLLNVNGGDTLAGYNVHSLALQVPFSWVTRDGSTPSDPASPAAVIGGWTTAHRQSTKVINPDGTVTSSGDFVQVSRLGHPLVNEVVMSLDLKDVFNSVPPSVDRTVPAVVERVTNPELAVLLNAIFGVNVPPTPRNDLVTIFLTGIPGVNQPPDVTPAEMLRLNLAIPGQNGDRMGLLAGDSSGFPNGRRLADDVTDISLQAVAGAVYPLLVDESFTPDPMATQLGDNVNANDKAFMSAFPYVAEPWQGVDTGQAQGPGVGSGGGGDGGGGGGGAAPLPDTGVEGGAVHFPETGHTLSGSFLSYWRANGGLPVFGYPISAEARVDGRVVQWFERNRFELHPENAAPYDVLLGRLGVEVLAQRGVDWKTLPTVAEADSGCLYFAETAHSLCDGFLSYWSSHGLEIDGQSGSSYSESLALFGFPISQPFTEKNAATGESYTVQYFERARFEYHPEHAGTPYAVQLGLLSRELGR